jgi:cell wall-associated NlpC family hydrolase
MRGERVSLLQKRLATLGYYTAAIDGVFGQRTQSAVTTFQMHSGLAPDGVVGSGTIQALNKPDSELEKQKKAASATANDKLASLLNQAKSLLGTPYTWGGTGPGGFDCSGFVYYLFALYGQHLPRMADGQFDVGSPVQRSEIRAGDLLFFATYEPGPSHVGIYLGDGNFIHASSAAEMVTITPVDKDYYRERYLGARRFF